jgi:peptidoglycan/xylan/chitin deacetylase (PgdA/CDA1 family)
MKRLALHAMRSVGLFALSRQLSSSMARILMYHNFSAPGATEPGTLNVEAICRQFEYLQKNFHVVPLTELADRLSSGRSLNKGTVALTIDDGRVNCYEFLFPLLKEFGIPATFFVVTSFINGDDWIWTDKVLWLSEQPNPPEQLSRINIDAFFRNLNRLHPEVRNAQIAALAASMAISIPRKAPAKYAPCSWTQLREMSDSGLVEIGSHTVTHPIMSSITDEESRYELTESRKQIEQSLGRTVTSFCFPNGQPQDFRPSQIQQVQEAGYQCSVLAHFGLVKSGTDPYQMPRVGMGSKYESVEISKFLDGIAYYQRAAKTIFAPASPPKA